MADAALLELQREVQAGGGPASRLRYARALRRAGQEDEAWRVLLPARDEPEVRRELGKAPAWREPFGSAGRGNQVDLPLPRGRPNLRWEAAVSEDAILSLLATPLGVVVSSGLGVLTPADTIVLDPDSGEVRHRHLGEEPLIIVGDVLFTSRGSALHAHDLWTGAALHETPIEGAVNSACWGQGMLLLWNGGGVWAFGLEDPRQPGRPAWTHGSPAGAGYAIRPKLAMVGDQVFFHGVEDFVCLDRCTGAVRWALSGVEGQPVADRHGLLIAREEAPSVSAYDLEGNQRWIASSVYLTALSHDWVLGYSDGHTLLIDRATGRRAETLESVDGIFLRDGLGCFTTHEGALRGGRPGREPQWSLRALGRECVTLGARQDWIYCGTRNGAVLGFGPEETA